MRPRRVLPLLAAIALLAASSFTAQAAGDGTGPGNPSARGEAARHDAIVAYWTPERMRTAIPRDISFDPTSGRFSPAAKPPGKPGGGGGGGGGGTVSVLGASWTNTNTLIYRASGKVYFVMSGTAYICSGSVVQDTRSGYSLVLTAGHCAYDETNRQFATNWLFIPRFDSNPTYTCADTAFGCWTANALVVHSGYANAGSYNSQATVYDYAIAAVGPGGKSNGQLDTTVGSFGILFSSVSAGTQTYAFGYPAAGKYGGSDLVYSAGAIQNDAYNANLTYALGSDLTGGSSGGPWLTSFAASTGNGTLTSLNSYTYSFQRNVMHGPKFGLSTQGVYNAANGATSNTIVQ